MATPKNKAVRIRPDIGSFGPINHNDRLVIHGMAGPFCSAGIAINGVELVFSPNGLDRVIRALKKVRKQLDADEARAV